jgi:hypothetical protein
MQGSRDREDVTEVLRRLIPGWEQSRAGPAASFVAERASSSSGSRAPRPKENESPEALSAQSYVHRVLERYLRLPGTAFVSSRHDRRCAQTLFEQGVPLEVVHAAMVIAVARRALRRGGSLPRVRALHFFLPVIEELLESPPDPGYVRYLEHKLEPLALEKASQSSSSHRRQSLGRG